jgi:uncharacterized protein YkwD
MRPFARGVATTILVLFALAGVLALAGVDVGIQLGEADPLDAAAADQSTAAATETAAAGASQPTIDAPASFDRAAIREQFYARLNEHRSEIPRATVSHDLTLHKAARLHSEDMAAKGYFAHESPDGDDFQDRVRRVGGQCTRGGENIASAWWRQQMTAGAGPDYLDSPADVARNLFLQWLNSPDHREIMEMRGVADVGLGVAMSDDGEIYATIVIC